MRERFGNPIEIAKDALRIATVAGIVVGGGYAMYGTNEQENAAIDAKCGGPARQDCTKVDTTTCGVFTSGIPVCTGEVIYEVKTPTPVTVLTGTT